MMLVCTAVPKITFANLILAAVTGENSNAEFIGGNEQLDSQSSGTIVRSHTGRYGDTPECTRVQ
jgi:hypothetical protein